MKRLKILLLALCFTLLPAYVWAVEFGGAIADNITALVFGVIVIIGGLAYGWLRFGIKTGLEKIGMGQFFPILDPFIQNLVASVEEEARQRFKDTGVAMGGEEKFEWVLERVNEFTKKIGIDIDTPTIRDWINGKVTDLRLAGLDKLQDEADKIAPPTV